MTTRKALGDVSNTTKSPKNGPGKPHQIKKNAVIELDHSLLTHVLTLLASNKRSAYQIFYRYERERMKRETGEEHKEDFHLDEINKRWHTLGGAQKDMLKKLAASETNEVIPIQNENLPPEASTPANEAVGQGKVIEKASPTHTIQPEVTAKKESGDNVAKQSDQAEIKSSGAPSEQEATKDDSNAKEAVETATVSPKDAEVEKEVPRETEQVAAAVVVKETIDLTKETVATGNEESTESASTSEQPEAGEEAKPQVKFPARKVVQLKKNTVASLGKKIECITIDDEEIATEAPKQDVEVGINKRKEIGDGEAVDSSLLEMQEEYMNMRKRMKLLEQEKMDKVKELETYKEQVTTLKTSFEQNQIQLSTAINEGVQAELDKQEKQKKEEKEKLLKTTTFVICDTNILHHHMTQLNNIITMYTPWVMIVIPQIVIRELDIQKNHETLGTQARFATSFIEKKQALKQLIIQQPNEHFSAIERRCNDDHIFSCCKYYDSHIAYAPSSEKVICCTGDRNLRLKVRSVKVCAATMEDLIPILKTQHESKRQSEDNSLSQSLRCSTSATQASAQSSTTQSSAAAPTLATQSSNGPVQPAKTSLPSLSSSTEFTASSQACAPQAAKASTQASAGFQFTAPAPSSATATSFQSLPDQFTARCAARPKPYKHKLGQRKPVKHNNVYYNSTHNSSYSNNSTSAYTDSYSKSSASNYPNNYSTSTYNTNSTNNSYPSNCSTYNTSSSYSDSYSKSSSSNYPNNYSSNSNPSSSYSNSYNQSSSCYSNNYPTSSTYNNNPTSSYSYANTYSSSYNTNPTPSYAGSNHPNYYAPNYNAPYRSNYNYTNSYNGSYGY